VARAAGVRPGQREEGHRLVLFTVSRQIAVSCICRKGAEPGYPRSCPAFEMRTRWTTAEVIACFDGFHEACRGRGR